MATLVPFRALRPARAAERVAAVPYDVVTTDEARVLASGNPLSFLHVSRAEIDLPPGTDPYAEAVYAKAAANLRKLTAEAPLTIEQAPALYVYQLRSGGHVQTGVAGCFSLDEYERGVIKKHERTRADKEDDRTRHMLALRAQTGPVFLVHRASVRIAAVVERTKTSRPQTFDFTADDGVQHTIWSIDPGDEYELVTAFATAGAMYIADGHHRAASAARARRQLQGPTAARGEWDTFLAVAFPENDVRILPYNRVVRDLGSWTSASFMEKLRERTVVTDGDATPDRPGHVGMFLDGRWYTISLGHAAPNASPDQRLDVSRLQDTVLAPLLGIGDVRADKRIDFVGGARGTAELEKLTRTGQAAVAFSMYPVSVHDLMTISDAGGIMPPKSTWFEPKLRDGLLSHLI